MVEEYYAASNFSNTTSFYYLNNFNNLASSYGNCLLNTGTAGYQLHELALFTAASAPLPLFLQLPFPQSRSFSILSVLSFFPQLKL